MAAYSAALVGAAARAPHRIQLKRTKGWKLRELSPGAVVVDRRTRYGNPFRMKDAIAAGYVIATPEGGRQLVVAAFRAWLDGDPDHANYFTADRARLLAALPLLAGHDLACWCPPGPCHADILLAAANGRTW